MRIGFDLQILEANRGGTAVYTRTLFAALQELDTENEYVPLTSKLRLPRRSLVSKVGNAALQVLYTNVLSIAQAARARVDLIHYPANIAALAAPCPMVVTIYDTMFQRFPETYDPYYLGFCRIFFPLSARRASRIITISEFSKQDIVHFCGVPESRVKVIYPGVAADLTSVNRDEARTFVLRHYQIGDSPYVLFTGEIGARKNLENLIKAFAQLQRMHQMMDVQLVLVGEKRNTQYAQKLDALIEASGLHRSVHWLGFVPQKHLACLISAASLVAYVSLCEGFGLPIVEAMACGTPVVTSNVSSMPEVIDDAGILVDPYSIEEIADGMRKILLDNQLREQLIARGLERAIKFTWENTARQTISLYEEVMQRKSASHSL